jgi:ADP-ribose pyrophosphatase YjhB (NUDIX family)
MQDGMHLAANVAIIEAGKVLLMQREDLEVWCLPGGEVDPGESLAQAAIREAREETGLEVELLRLTGVYSRTGGEVCFHVASYAARPVGGFLAGQPGEVIDLAYWAPDALPEPMFWWHRQQIADAFAGVGGSAAWNMRVETAEPYGSRQELYARRDSSGLSRQGFYRYFFESRGRGEARREVG